MTELVPLHHERQAWNAIHGKQLETHDDHLTAEQAEQINKHFDIKIYTGVHGIVGGDVVENPHNILAIPTATEYDAAASVVEGLQPGDVLFREAVGFTRAVESPIPTDAELAEAIHSPNPAQAFLGMLALREVPEARAAVLQQLESERAAGTISAWDYAQGPALAKGIPVVKADIDKFKEDKVAQVGGKSMAVLDRSPDPYERAIAGRAHRRREYAARNIMKDWALDNLPPDDQVAERKPQLALLFGSGHKEDLPRAFDELGLQAEVISLAQTDMHDRLQEHMAQRAPKQLATLAKLATTFAVINHVRSGSPVKLDRIDSPSAQAAAAKRRARTALHKSHSSKLPARDWPKN